MQALFIVVGSLLLLGAVLKLISWYRRSQLTHKIPEDQIVRALRGASLLVRTQGPPVFPGMSTTKANRSIGDLVLTADRMLLVCNRGPLLDIGPERGRKLSSARCTGPGRLVLEGELPVPAGVTGRYRIEVAADDAPSWASALAPFVRPEAGQQYTSWAG